MGELYRLDFASGKAYIGITRNTATERFNGHRYAARNSGKGVVYAAWRKHGEPRLTVLAIIESEADLLAAERSAIASHQTLHPHGYNLGPGGDVPPSMNPDVADKIRQRLKGRTVPREQVEARAAAARGRKASSQAIEHMRAAQRGRTFTEEARARMSAAALGRKHSPETRRRMAEAQRARRLSETQP